MPLRAPLSPLPNGRATHRKPARLKVHTQTPATPKPCVVLAKQAVSPASSVKDDAQHASTPGLFSPLNNLLFSPPAPLQHTGLTPMLASLRLESPAAVATTVVNDSSPPTKLGSSSVIVRAIGCAAAGALVIAVILALFAPAPTSLAPPPATVTASRPPLPLPPAPALQPLANKAARPSTGDALGATPPEWSAPNPSNGEAPAAQESARVEPPMVAAPVAPEAPVQLVDTSLASPPVIDLDSISSSVRSAVLEAASRAAAKAATSVAKAKVAEDEAKFKAEMEAAEAATQVLEAASTVQAAAAESQVEPIMELNMEPEAELEYTAVASTVESAPGPVIRVATPGESQASLPLLAFNCTCHTPLEPTTLSAAAAIRAALLASIAFESPLSRTAKVADDAWLAPLAALYARDGWPLYVGPRRTPQQPSSPGTCPLVRPAWRNATEAFFLATAERVTAERVTSERPLALAEATPAAASGASVAAVAPPSMARYESNHSWLPGPAVRTPVAGSRALARPAAPLAALLVQRAAAHGKFINAIVLIDTSWYALPPLCLGLPSWARGHPLLSSSRALALVPLERLAGVERATEIDEAVDAPTCPSPFAASAALVALETVGAPRDGLLSRAPRVHATLHFARPALIATEGHGVEGDDDDDDAAVVEAGHSGVESASALVGFVWTEVRSVMSVAAEAMDEAATTARSAASRDAQVMREQVAAEATHAVGATPSDTLPDAAATPEPIEPTSEAGPPPLLVCLTTVASALLLVLAVLLEGRHEPEARALAPEESAAAIAVAALVEPPSPLVTSHDVRADIRGALCTGEQMTATPSSALVPAGAPADGALLLYSAPSTSDTPRRISAQSLLAPPSASGRALLEGAVDEGLYGGIQPFCLFDLTPSNKSKSSRKK